MAKARLSLLAKIVACLVVLATGDILLYGYSGGSVVGLFGLVWLGAIVLTRPSVRHSWAGRVSVIAAALFALIVIYAPGLLGAVLFLVALGTATLLPRHCFDHAGLWAVRLAALGLRAPIGPVSDLGRVAKLPGRRGQTVIGVVSLLAIPLLGGALFLTLFAHANPVLMSALNALRMPQTGPLIWHVPLWLFILTLVWPTLRPRALRFDSYLEKDKSLLPDLPVGTMVITLVVFNAVFALENGLDIVFLWSGATLPDGVTLADYAHRGAYTLIATALLAGLFVLVAMRPGADAAKNSLVRMLLLAWIVQNVVLVASSVLRVLDYIDAYSLTVMRIAALMWMGLVATGLMLICWRFLAGRSAAWLINANAIAAALVLTGASIVDLGAMAARWNVDHLRDPGQLDLCYLTRQGSSALIPLIELRDAPIGSAMRDQAVYLSQKGYIDLVRQQSDWQGWSWRDARRLERARPMLDGDAREPLPAPHGRHCDGSLRPPPPPQVVPEALTTPPESAPTAPTPLTPEQNP